MTATWTATGNPPGQSTTSGICTFNAVNIGTPGASDLIVAIFNCQGAAATGLSCNGVAMTLQSAETVVLSALQIWSIDATTAGVVGSATTTFVATSGGNMSVEVIQVGKMQGAQFTPDNTGNNPAIGTSIPVTVTAGGMAIVAAFAGSTVSPTWSGGTQDFQTIDLSGTQSVFMVHAPTTGTVSESGIAGGIHFAYAAWPPSSVAQTPTWAEVVLGG